jgi:hypothetical protein
MQAVRFAAAAWLVASIPWQLPKFSMQTLRALFAHLPELTVAVLVAAPLPGLVGLLSIVRWLRRRPGGRVSPLAAATRWATILAILGLALPFNVVDQASAVSALVLRGSQFVALLFLFDGPLVPEDRGQRAAAAGRRAHRTPTARGRSERS